MLDSGSRDRTREIALSSGARVLVRPFDDYASQRNFGLSQIEYRNPWVLMLDADERVPPELRTEIELRVAGAGPQVGLFRVRRRDFLYDTWIRGSGGYPTWFPRLARVGRVRVERSVNEEYHTDGTVEALDRHLHHYPFSKGLDRWIGRHNLYSTMEANLMADRAREPLGAVLRRLVTADPVRRRKAVKTLVYRVPGRPLLVFFALYIVRRGFMEGRAGFTFAMLRAWYEFLIDCKRREVVRGGGGTGS